MTEDGDGPVGSSPRKTLAPVMTEDHAAPEAKEESHCPHCRTVVRADAEHVTCSTCGALVALQYSQAGLRPLILRTWSANTALEEVSRKFSRGPEFAKKLPTIVALLRRATEQYALLALYLLEERERVKAQVNFEGLQLIASRAMLPTVFDHMQGFFEDKVLASTALDAILVELCGVAVTSDLIAYEYWLKPVKERPDEWGKLHDLWLSIDTGQLLGFPDPLAGAAPAVGLGALLDYDAMTAMKHALHGQALDDGKRRKFFDKVMKSLALRGAFETLPPYLPVRPG